MTFTAGSQSIVATAAYAADGRHLVANYKHCDRTNLLDISGLLTIMRQAVAAAGATILHENVHVFDNGGMTAVFLLSESHASIHTYPEHQGCFIDLFTCGATCNGGKFDAVLRAYLKPESVDCHSLSRNLTT